MSCLKFIDKIAGKALVSFFCPSQKAGTVIESVKSVLLIRPGGIGDAVLLLPVIKTLKSSFPGAIIDILCEKRNADIFMFSKEMGRIYHYDRNFQLFHCLKNKYDIVIDTEQWHRLSAIVAYLTGAPIRIGFDTNERARLFTHQIPYNHNEFEVYSFFHLIEPLIGNKIDFGEDEPFIDIENKSVSDPIFGAIGAKNKLIAIFPGASIEERRWGGKRYAEVAKALTNEGYKIIILGSAMDRIDAGHIKREVSDSINLTGKTNLNDVAAILKICRLLITADSGIMHIAYAVGTPTISLFGPGREKKWAPKGKRHIVINKHFICSPCTKFGYTPRCKSNIKCLSEITVDEILKAVKMILNN